MAPRPSSSAAPLSAPPKARFAIVVSRFNEDITGRLRDGALATFGECGVAADRVTVATVPGAFELPLVAHRLAASGKYTAVLCLGAVIQGDTDHDKYINQAVAQGIMQAGLETGIPVLFGVLTCTTLQQAQDRAGGKVGNKGSEAAMAAIEMANLLTTLE
jgi:6,7-dimethyl-8-ribityllumazine synthase